jgi:hypothetical protein
MVEAQDQRERSEDLRRMAREHLEALEYAEKMKSIVDPTNLPKPKAGAR